MRLLPAAGVGGRIAAPVADRRGLRDRFDDAVIGGRVVLGRGVKIGAGARIEGSVLLDGATVGATHAHHGRDHRAAAEIGARCQLDGGVVLGEGVALGRLTTC